MTDEELRGIREKAWDEGAVYTFIHTGEGWNSEYPFDDGQDLSFIPIITEDNPYRREKQHE